MEWGGGEGVSKASVTPLLHSHRFPSAALKESSLYSMLLCEKAIGQLCSSNMSLIFRWSKTESSIDGVQTSRRLG